MGERIGHFGLFHSLKTQMVFGTMLLLGITIGSISYSLIIHEKMILKNEIERSVALHGKNIAMSSAKALLRPDPEFELYPLIDQIIKRSTQVVSVMVTDSEGLIQGHHILQKIGKPYREDLIGYQPVTVGEDGEGGSLYQKYDSYYFVTPVRSLDKEIGKVYLVYSKEEFHRSINRAIMITLICASAAFVLGITLSLIGFRMISRPLDILIAGTRSFGEGNLDERIEVRTKNELRLLAESFNEMATKISAAQTELITKERMARELEIAREIQSTLLPKNVSAPPGFEIGHYYRSATEVGGDYLDVIPIDESKTVLVMADVSGKGVPGLVVMGMVKIMVQEFATKGLSPKTVINRLNSSLAKTTKDNMFVTFFYGIFDRDNSELLFSNAGHNPLVIYSHSTGASRFLKMSGMPLGIMPEKYFSERLMEYRCRLEPGDLVLQYTDGLNESRNETGERFKFERILGISDRQAGYGAKKLVSTLIETEQEFRGPMPQADDITLLALSATVRQPSNKEQTGV